MQDGKTAEVGAEEASWKERILRDPAGGRGGVGFLTRAVSSRRVTRSDLHF